MTLVLQLLDQIFEESCLKTNEGENIVISRKSSRKCIGRTQSMMKQNNRGGGRRVVTPHKSIHNNELEGKRKGKNGMSLF